MRVLGIESTCDETACSVVEDGSTILSNVIATQTDLLAQWGGVFPELACRRHIDVIPSVIERALQEANTTLSQIDLIAVAAGPGLIGALLVGVNMAKALALSLNKPLICINHVDAHLYAAMMGQEERIFPSLGVVVSGGHTFLTKIHGIGSYELIGTTVDDAIGEAFDKVARLLGFPYPGGPFIEKLAITGDPSRYPFKAGKVKGKPWHFSYSGLKTSVLYAIKGQDAEKESSLKEEDKPHLAASFQHTAFHDLAKRAASACQVFSLNAIYVGGGVSRNLTLRKLFSELADAIPVYFPQDILCLDNAAMIAGLGYHQFLQSGPSPLSFQPFTRS